MTEDKPIDSLAIPKRQKVFDQTLLPAGEVLPIWTNVSLDTKLPLPPSPRNRFVLFTSKLGEPKYRSHQTYDFDLSNPQGREAPGPYDSLADPTLKYYFNSPGMRQHLIDAGLITDNGEIRCSLKEFNQYREFIRYKAVTELALQKKREKRLEEEKLNKMLEDWPRAQKVKKSDRLRMTRSEPPRDNWQINGLEMYKEDLATKFKLREKVKLETELKRNKKKKTLKKDKDKEDSQNDLNYKPSDHRGQSLINIMRHKEEELKRRLEEQRRKKQEEHIKKLEENWQHRQQRQLLQLQYESDLEAKATEKRVYLIKDREKALQQQRKKQEEKLKKIRQEIAKHESRKPGNYSNWDNTDNNGTYIEQ